jgi:hypothetical protein
MAFQFLLDWTILRNEKGKSTPILKQKWFHVVVFFFFEHLYTLYTQAESSSKGAQDSPPQGNGELEV